MSLTMFSIITGDDVRNLPWDTLMLVAGGLSLGLAIQETGLAPYYAGLLNDFDLNFYMLVVVFSLLTVVLSNLMSNTATTTILIPIAIILVSSNIAVLPNCYCAKCFCSTALTYFYSSKRYSIQYWKIISKKF